MENSERNIKMKRIRIKIDRPAYGGLYIGRFNGKIVMLKGAALPGETAECVVEKDKRDILFASVAKTIETSPDRIEPKCKLFGLCGGCHLQHTFYSKQIELKENILSDSLRRTAKIDIHLSPPVTGNSPWKYRCRGQFKTESGKIGFYREKSRDVIEVDNCPLMEDEINHALKEVKRLINMVGGKEIHISCGDGLIALLKIPDIRMDSAALNKVSSRFLDSGFSGLMIKTGDKDILTYGRPYITLPLEDFRYTVSAMSFVQSNWELNQALVRLIKETLTPFNGKKILDLYAGAGNFSLLLSGDAEVTCIEENPYAVKDGLKNIEINRISSVSFIRSSAEAFKTHEKFDIVILDPPRPGLTKEAIRNVLSIMPQQIIYISCDPATFSRDIKKLAAIYDIESVRMVDLFPQTFHIESLAILRLR